ncbi:hypothetical protein CpB0213 [Chlamydia pneumoniae TW-183]|uniref:Uncharacterized protein n=3 Tax=Chlamydia pneumoniae TaxID=83558 RepID=A0ABN3YQB8_CHLPN|nr:hypothetical protein CP_0557 [Chlamydia pneumoniae AR39]AAP98146.1 hypothetical protein CpB0213 [Chlamydia pneumoniae TW-183]
MKMETYSFSTELQKNTSLYIMEKLDSYFSFQGKRTRVIAITPAGLAIAYEQNIHLSMTVKILKVLSFPRSLLRTTSLWYRP